MQYIVQNGVQKGTQIWKNLIKTGLESQKNKFGTYVHANVKIRTNRCPLRLDFDAPSCTESLFSLFQFCSISAKLGGPKPPKLNPMGVYGSTQMKRERFRKHQKNVTTKTSTNVTNLLQKEGPPNGFVFVFVGSPSQDGLQGVPGQAPRPKKHVKMEALKRIVCCFVSSISYSLEAFRRCFVHSMNNVLIILDVKFIVMFV